MTYEEFINDILSKRGRFELKENKETHHITPRCLGGTDDEENLINLTYQEHYTAHELLALENPDNFKLICAWNRMSFKDGLYIDANIYILI